LARYEADFRAAADTPLTLEELLVLLDGSGKDARTREDAIACFLAGGEGWREAVKMLGGAFAGEVTGLKERKAD